MLSSLRQTTRFLPRFVPHRAYVRSVSRPQEDEAFRIISELDAEPADDPVKSGTTSSEQTTEAANKPDLDAMHDYIPPAQSPTLRLFATMIMKDGKFATASNRISRMLLHIHSMTQSKPMPIVEEAVRLASPALKLKKLQKGSVVVHSPAPLTDRQRTRMGIHWLIEGANKVGRPGKNIEDRLAREIIDTVRGKSHALEEKEKLHKTALVNRSSISRG